jgi:tetratricopeptide (TPR) repeat protein
MNVIQVPARLVLGLYLVVDNLLPFIVSRGAGTGVAHGAHIGGFAAGLALAWLLDRREVEARPREYRQPEVVRAGPREPIADALARGDYATAARAYFALDPGETRRLLDPEQALALADWLAVNGHPDAALVVYRRMLRDYPGGPGAAEAHVGAGLVQLHSKGQLAPAYQHFLDALDLSPSAETAEQARAGLAAIAARQRSSRAR